MLANSFTLSVNTDNDDGTTAEVEYVFNRYDDQSPNRSEYIEDTDHSLSLRDKIGFYRTFPKPSGNFPGTAKCAAKVTKDFVVPGMDSSTSITVPAIIDVGFSFPIGMTEEQRTALRMRVVALLSSDTIMLPLTGQLQV